MHKIDKAAGISSLEVPSSRGRKQFKPFILRVPVLFFVSSVALALFGVLEYASKTLPHASKGYSMWKVEQARNTSSSSLQKRQQTVSFTNVSSIVITTSVSASITSKETVTEATNPNAFVATASTITTTPPLAGATNPNAFVDTARTSTTTDSTTSKQIVTEATNPNAFVATASTIATTAPIVGATNPNVFVDTARTATVTSNPTIAASTAPDAFVDTKITTSMTEFPTPGATNPNAFVATVSTISGIVTSVTISNAYVPTITSVAVAVSYSTSSNGLVQTISSSYTTAFLASSRYIDQTSIITYMITELGTSTSSFVTTDISGKATTVVSAVPFTTVRQTTTAVTTPKAIDEVSIMTYMTTELGTSTSSFVTTDADGRATTVLSAVPYTTVRQTSSAVTRPKAAKNNNPRVFVKIESWPLWEIFVGGYCPVFLAVMFKLFWTSIYAKIKLIEPFMRMARPEGATASDTLHTYYLSSYLMPDAVFSMMKGHWLIFWSALVYLAVGLLAPLASEVLFLDTNWNCPAPKYDELSRNNPCWPPKLSVDPLMIRLLQGLLVFVAIMTINLMVMVIRTPTGLYSDPSSIGAIASLTHHPEVLEDFRQLGDEALLKDVRRQLGTRRYKLDDYQRGDGTWRYGFVPVSPASTIAYDWNVETELNSKKLKRTKTFSEGSRQQAIWDAVSDWSFTVLLLATMGILIGYFKDSGDTAYNRFFNSNSFGPRFVMTIAGSIISLNFKRLERDAHTLAPYHALSHTPQAASSTILLQRRSLPYSALFSMTYNRHALASYLAFIAILSDILVIAIAGIPYSPGHIYVEFLACFYVTIVILGLMVLGIVMTMIWRRWTPDLPRTPDTILAVMSYVADSRLLDDFDGCEGLRSREVENRVNGLGKRYGYGQYVGVDGQTKWMVDEDCSLGA
ncbi:hypothetical protein E2P81_ATG01997 [Venturia nashicola]|uniref:Uncharacterized protein n=1 Tax=Venturia nashicola TaxID=86259 RepID=A0A4Z1PLD9_9PEZI|nr:hypothetical protein E6O75_ATG02038 [Venturia nashicola]TLD35694.1 hypothetical protein E2P81_ATG01997 [Venturia nashicola]